MRKVVSGVLSAGNTTSVSEALVLYTPLIPNTLLDWGEPKMYVALDTSMLGNRYGLIRLSMWIPH
jgi:hypothetical protein